MDATLLKRRIEQFLKRNATSVASSSLRSEAPDVVDLSGLLLIPDQEQFLREAYRIILRREIDPSGFFHYSRILKEGTSRVAVLRAIARSEEARRTGVKFTGIDLETKGRRISVGGKITAFLERFSGRLYSRLASVYRAAFVVPTELIDKKLDYILEDLIRRIDQLSSKVDESSVALRAEMRETGRSVANAIEQSSSDEKGEWNRRLAWLEARLRSVEQGLAGLRSDCRAQAAVLQAHFRTLAEQTARLGGLLRQDLADTRDAVERTARQAVRECEELRQSLLALEAGWSAGMESIEAALGGLRSNVPGEATDLNSLGKMLASRMDRLEGLVEKEIRGLSEAFGTAAGLVIRSGEEEGRKADTLAEGLFSPQTQLSAISTKVDKVIEAQQSCRKPRVDEQPAAFPAVASSGKGQVLDVGAKDPASRETTSPRPVIRINDSVVVTEVEGHLLAMPAGEWRLVAYFAFRGFPEPGLLKAFRSLLRPGMVVVDVGAHLGLYTLEAARGLQGQGRIYSFEPTPSTFALLRENIQLNGHRESGVVVARQEAVLDRCGRAVLYVHPENSGHNTLYWSPECQGAVDVETVALDEFLAGEAEAHLVKIDAEGAEPFILRGMRKVIARSPRINVFLEFAGSHLQRAGVAPGQFLKEIGAMGLEISIVDDLTGEALDCDLETLSRRPSSNLWLRWK